MEFRLVEAEDALGVIQAHHNAIRVTAKKDYSAEIIEVWAKLPISNKMIEHYINVAMKEEITVVAVEQARVVGFSSIVVAHNELRAVYVDPSVAKRGVGSELLRRIEQIAREKGCAELQMDSSITAEPFYRKHGYIEISKGEHILSGGLKMACVKMKKLL